MPMPLVTIVGRPNVGKSTVFNLLAGHRISIVEPTAGVTRDRVTAEVELDGRKVELTDTGGIGIVDVDELSEDVERQIEVAIAAADVIIFMISARDGVTTLDESIAERLHTVGKKVILCANKADTARYEQDAAEAFTLGFGEPVILAAKQGLGRGDLIERLVAALPPIDPNAPAEAEGGPIKIAIVGRRNVGKSTFVNALCDEERVIASEIAGTTRDAIDVRFERDGQTFIAIDTAGMRKKSRVDHAIELFSQSRTELSIRRADVVVLMLDVSEKIAQTDALLSSWVEAARKPCVIVGNKWDLAQDRMEPEAYHEYLVDHLRGLQFCPMVLTSALHKQGVWHVLEVAKDLYRQSHQRVATGELNRCVTEAVARVAPRVKGIVPKIYFATQTDIAPPTIVFMVNKPDLFDDRYRRYLMNRLRETFDFGEVPLELVFRERFTQYDEGERRKRAKKRRDNVKRDVRASEGRGRGRRVEERIADDAAEAILDAAAPGAASGEGGAEGGTSRKPATKAAPARKPYRRPITRKAGSRKKGR